MFVRKRGGKSFFRIFINDWIDLFKEIGEEINKLWKKINGKKKK